AKSVYRKILEIDPTDIKATLALQRKKSQANNTLLPLFQDTDIAIDLKIKELFPYIERIAGGDPAELETALLLAKTLTEAHPQEAKAFAAYGDLLYHSGDIQTAQTQYKQTLALDDTVYPVWEQLMYSHLDLQQFSQLLETSVAAMDVFPNQARIYYLNAVAQRALNASEDALEMLEEAQLMAGKDQRLKFDVLAQMGAAYFDLKDFESAKNKVEGALEINSQAYTLVEKYGDILAALGEQKAAMEQWKRAKKLGADSAELRQKIAGEGSK
ncbi:MAG: hypothetical protein AAF738_10350, partial [Bacteroidota bacterium]